MRIHEFLASFQETRSASFRCWQVVILAIRSITAISVSIVANHVWSFFTQKSKECEAAPPFSSFWSSVISFFASVETLFFVYYLFTRRRVNSRKPLPHRCSTPDERRRLIHQCLKAVRPTPAEEAAEQQAKEQPGGGHPPPISPYLRSAIERWFFGVSLDFISRRDFSEWAAWAFFNEELESLNPDHRKELEGHVDWFENEVQWKFPLWTMQPTAATAASRVKSMRLSLDPVYDTQRPFFYYAVIYVVYGFGLLAVKALGFERKQTHGEKDGSSSSALRVLYRPASTSSTVNTAATGENGNDGSGHGSSGGGGGGSGVAGDGNDNGGLPVVFIHGIGIGFAHYLFLLMRLPRSVPCYLVEWPHVCMQVVDCGWSVCNKWCW